MLGNTERRRSLEACFLTFGSAEAALPDRLQGHDALSCHWVLAIQRFQGLDGHVPPSLEPTIPDSGIDAVVIGAEDPNDGARCNIFDKLAFSCSELGRAI